MLRSKESLSCPLTPHETSPLMALVAAQEPVSGRGMPHQGEPMGAGMDGVRSRRYAPQHHFARKANHKGARSRGRESRNTVCVGTLARKGSLECHNPHS